jgi:serine/threonine-protein kinase
MSDEARLRELLEEALGSDRTPEEVCARDPELVGELRRRLEQWRLVRDELDVLFPSNTTALKEGLGQADDLVESLPAIEGYEVYSVLGRGGMGVVYKARHLALKRLVALKMLLTGDYGRASEKLRIRREAEALAKLSHPHIVQVHDVGEVGGRPYFTMEFMGGGSLKEKLAGAPQPAEYALAMMVNLAGAVKAAHTSGIVHRDLKPANVLLTTDGVAKVSDFGLARQLEDENLTLPGARIGTPSYMAPEQASKKWGDVGPLADVYALGAVLYEMMTGRPPFRGESAAETERQLLNEEVVSPTRLNARVPRDLETICLKCLQKEQGRRYASAAALGEDLERFQRGEPIEARRVGRAERTFKWVRRRPGAATALGISGVLALVLAAGGAWFVSQRSAVRKMVESDLKEAANLQLESKWREADAAIERAKIHLGEHGQQDLVRRLEAARRDSELVTLLEQIRMKGNVVRIKLVDSEYLDALKRGEIGGPNQDPEEVAGRIRASNIKYALITALDDWLCESYKYRGWALEVLRRADHDPTGWRDHMRSAAVWENPKALADGALAAPYADQPVPFLLSMANQLKGMGLSAASTITLLKRVQEAHPDDFWINMTLADELGKQQDLRDQLQYLQAAEAIRPNAATVRIYLGNVQFSLGQREEALRQYREAVRLEPDNFAAKECLGVCLSQTQREAEAIPILQEVVRLCPANPKVTYYVLGQSLQRVGREEESVPAYRKSISFGPFRDSQQILQGILIRQKHWDQVESVWQDAIKADPARHDSWDGYAEYCLFLGRAREYRRLRGLLLDRFGKDKSPTVCDRAGRACLLLGDDRQAVVRAAAMIERAVQAKGPDTATLHPYFMVGKGLAEYRLGNMDAALSAVEGDGAQVLRPMPQLIAAMAHWQLGQQQIARKLLAEAVLSFDWSRGNATTHEAWIYHVLRREAEGLIVPNFRELIGSSAQPQNNDERLVLLGVCEFEDLRGRCAQLWLDALNASAELANNHAVDAARAAALAGCGGGKDAVKFTDEDRRRWRERSVDLLLSRVDILERLLSSAPPQKGAIRSDLQALQRASELAGLRDLDRVSHLPKSEQERCAALWRRVGAVLDRANQN